MQIFASTCNRSTDKQLKQLQDGKFPDGRRRVIQQIGIITAFPGSIVLIRESSELEGIFTLPGLAKSSLEL